MSHRGESVGFVLFCWVSLSCHFLFYFEIITLLSLFCWVSLSCHFLFYFEIITLLSFQVTYPSSCVTTLIVFPDFQLCPPVPYSLHVYLQSVSPFVLCQCVRFCPRVRTFTRHSYQAIVFCSIAFLQVSDFDFVSFVS